MLMVVFNILVDLLKLDSKIIIQFQKLYLKEVFREIQRGYEITHSLNCELKNSSIS